MAVRDFIPEGEDLTGEEKARYGVRTQESGIQRPNDFVPDEAGRFEDRTREEKEQFARDAAIASVARRNAEVASEADRQLKDRSEAQARDFMRNMSSADREVYLRAEKDGLNRKEIFEEFGEPQEDEPQGEGKVAEFGAVKAANRDDAREAHEFPTATVSPSDRLHRGIRQAQAGEKVDDEPLSVHEVASVKASADLDEHYPGDTDNDGLIDEDVLPPHVSPEDVAPDRTAEVNEAKARKAAESAADQGDGYEPSLTPDNDEDVVREAEEAADEREASEDEDEDARAAVTGPQQDAEREGEEPTEATEEGATPAKADESEGEVSDPSLEPLPKEEAKKVTKKRKAAQKKASAKAKKSEDE